MATFGRSREAVREEAVAPLQRAISCVSSAVVVRGRPEQEDVGYWTLSDRSVAMQGPSRISFSFLHSYRLSQDADGTHDWQLSSRNYFYQVNGETGSELIAFHWHPGRADQPDFPHLHVSGIAGPVMIYKKNHVPTGRVSLESVVRFLIAELQVRPLRGDWERVLEVGERSFMTRRS